MGLVRWLILRYTHLASAVELEQTIQVFIRRYNQAARLIRWTYAIEKLEKKLGMHV